MSLDETGIPKNLFREIKKPAKMLMVNTAIWRIIKFLWKFMKSFKNKKLNRKVTNSN